MVAAREIEWARPALADSPNAPLRLDVAAKIAFPDGTMGAAGLRKERDRGRLVTEMIAGKEYVTLAAIERMRELCRAQARESASFGGKKAGKPTGRSAARPGGSSKTQGGDVPLDAARANLLKLKGSSRNTSPSRHEPGRERDREPDQISIADVINVYSGDVVAHNPSATYRNETASRLLAILDFFGHKTLAEINGALCREYINGPAKPGRKLPTRSSGRRQLEDLRAAINHIMRKDFARRLRRSCCRKDQTPRKER